jgi:hypothetical protein
MQIRTIYLMVIILGIFCIYVYKFYDKIKTAIKKIEIETTMIRENVVV